MRSILLLVSCLMIPCLAGELTFSEVTKDVRAAPDARTVTADFSFENKSGEDVTISRYEASCSCMSVQVQGGKLQYAPGEKGVIRALFDMGNFSGSVDKAVQVWLEGDSESKPSIRLVTNVTIPVLVEVEPKTLRWDLGAKAEPRTLEVRMNHSEPIHVKSVSCSNPNFKLELKTVEDGKHYELEVTPLNTSSQGLGVIHIETDCPVSRQASQRAFTVIRKPTAAEEGK